MDLREHAVGIAEVLDHVLEQDLVEALVLERPGQDVEVVDDVRVGVRRAVDAHRAGMLLGSAAHVQQLTCAHGMQVELRRIGESMQQVHARRNGSLPRHDAG